MRTAKDCLHVSRCPLEDDHPNLQTWNMTYEEVTTNRFLKRNDYVLVEILIDMSWDRKFINKFLGAPTLSKITWCWGHSLTSASIGASASTGTMSDDVHLLLSLLPKIGHSHAWSLFSLVGLSLSGSGRWPECPESFFRKIRFTLTEYNHIITYKIEHSPCCPVPDWWIGELPAPT